MISGRYDISDLQQNIPPLYHFLLQVSTTKTKGKQKCCIQIKPSPAVTVPTLSIPSYIMVSIRLCVCCMLTFPHL